MATSDADVAGLRRREFTRLGSMAYLDHAGATLHSERQLQEAMACLNEAPFGNPHSQSEPSRRSSHATEQASDLP